MKTKKISLLLLFLLASFSICFGQNVERNQNIDAVKYFDENKRWYNEFTEHWFQFFDIPEDEIRNSIIQFEKISKDLKTSKNDWEGTYGNGGDTHGDYIHWSKNSGFVWLVVNKCNGGPMKITRGKVLITDSVVKFIPKKVLTSSFEHGGHSHNKVDEYKIREFIFPKLRKVSYAIETNEAAKFANDVAGLNTVFSGLPYDYFYFSKVSQQPIGSLNELPVFPAGYEKFVKKPVKATIISIEKTFRRDKKIAPDEEDNEYFKDIARNYDDLVTELKLNVGEASNIAPDVILNIISVNDGDKTTAVKTIRVFKNYSIGEYVTAVPKKTCQKTEFESCEAEGRIKLSKGLKLSSTGKW